MTGYRFVLWLIAAAMATAPGCSCTKSPAPPPDPVVRTLCLEAGPRLNWHAERANTLYVRMLQLSTLDFFRQADAQSLLDSKSTVTGAVGTPIEKTLYPGTRLEVQVREATDAQYLGIVAGYYGAGAAKAHRPLASLGVVKKGDDDDDDEEDEDDKKPKGPCIVFGASAIEQP